MSRKNGISDIRLIKIDVEGAELQVVKGMTNFLMKEEPIFLIEFNNQDNFQDVQIFLRDFGYEVERKLGEAEYGFWIVFRRRK